MHYEYLNSLSICSSIVSSYIIWILFDNAIPNTDENKEIKNINTVHMFANGTLGLTCYIIDMQKQEIYHISNRLNQ